MSVKPFTNFLNDPERMGRLLSRLDRVAEKEQKEAEREQTKISDHSDKPYLKNSTTKPVEKLGKIRF